MMKRISKILIVFILLFSIGITSVSAATLTFYRWRKDNSELPITYNWYTETGHHDLCAGAKSVACKEMYPYWNLYYVTEGSSTYITYCVNPQKDIHHNTEMSVKETLSSMRFSDSSLSAAEKEARINLLKRLLLFGYNPDPTNSTSLDTLYNQDPHNYLKLIAMQVLVWEVMEGGRTTFDTVEPDGWNGEYSFYNQVIKPNGSDSTASNTLYAYYHKFRNDARLAEQAKPAPAFNESHYILAWDSANKRYKATVSGIGDYNKCTSSDPSKVTVSVSGDNLLVTSTGSNTVKDVTITCKYYRGTGASDQSQSELFKYFSFKEDYSGTQDMVYGSGWKIYTKAFTVGSENTDFAIKKIDTEGQPVSNVSFNLTHINNQNYSVTIDSNTTTRYSLNYSGQYRVSEISSTVPKGYEKIKDFNININGRTHKVTSCDNQGVDSNGNMTCLNGQVVVKYNGDTIELNIINVAKNFKILKVNKSGNAINGATFVIKNKSGNTMKFSMATGNIYKYDTEGTITSLSNGSLSSYPVSLLPEGEYAIVETAVPYPYRLPDAEEDRTTWIKIDSNRNLLVYSNAQKKYVSSADAIVRVTNYTTKFNIIKTGHGTPLEGVQFELYNSDKTEKIKCNLVSPGVYSYVDNQASVENYVYVTNSSGYITFNNLPEGKYYLKEIYTIPPYVLPTGNAVYTEIDIKIDPSGVSINGSYTNDTEVISNTPNSFNFYKRDTEGNPLTTGKYKLQKYDKEAKKYVDLKLVEVPNDGTYSDNTDVYKVDEKNGKIQFTLTKGVATFIDMESSTTYRIIETVAPAGYTKASTKDTATVHIDEHGNASGLLVLIDQKIVKEDDSAYAELIINIQTGKQRIMYAAVIVIVISIIAGLIVYNNRKK